MLNDRGVSGLGWARYVMAIALLGPGFVLAGTGAARAEPILSVVPSSSHVTMGSLFWLDFVVGGTDSGPADDIEDLFAYQFGVAFDPSLLNAIGVSEGSFLSSAGSTSFVPGVIDNAAGTITFNANSLIGLGPGASGAGSLLRVQFAAVALGTSVVAPTINVSDGDGLFDSSLFFIGFQTEGGEVTVVSTSVPEASTLLLLSVGIMALAAERRRRRRD